MGVRIEILGTAQDIRTQTNVVYAKLSIPDYLTLVGENFDEFAIQRRREKHKAYDRLRDDARNGALLPAITLAVKPELVSQFLPLVRNNDWPALASALGHPNQASILDGLQLTYILSDLAKSGFDFMEGQTLLVEFWFEPEIKNLIYRIIVLNAGQKPMSMRHQIDVLFSIFKQDFEGEIENLELFVERSGGRRNRPRKYALDRVITAYQSFLSKSPEVKRENIVAQQLTEEEILASSEEELSQKLDLFKKYLAQYAALDDQICRVYVAPAPIERSDGIIPTGLEWFGSENVMNSFFAAIAKTDKQDRVDASLSVLSAQLISSTPAEDPLGLETQRQLERAIDPRKTNVGVAARKILFGAFREYFREEGEIPLRECWIAAAE